MRALVHTQRKDENYKFEYADSKVGGLQSDSPEAGKLRLARRCLCTSRPENGIAADHFTRTNVLTTEKNCVAANPRAIANR